MAVSARNEFWENCSETALQTERPLVAGCLGPYGAYLADGSEYQGNYISSVSKQTLEEFFSPTISALIAGGVDLLAFDTIPSMEEARIISEIVGRHAPDMPVWISFSCKDEQHVNHGESFAEAARSLLASEQVFGIGINCTPPQYITPLLKSLCCDVKEKKTVIVYPNSGEVWQNNGWVWLPDTPHLHLLDYVQEWVACGAKWIGGCCRVQPEQITKIRRRLLPSDKTNISP